MKKYITIPLLEIAALMLTASCSQEDFPIPGADEAQVLTVRVSDAGYISDTPTRTVETDYRTDFTDGDACGFYLVRDGEEVISNLKLVAKNTPEGLVLSPADGSDIKIDDMNFETFLYYPYQEDMTGKTDPSAPDDAQFFYNLIYDWKPATDQSDYTTGYSASDLMTAKGAIANGNVVFSMSHRMSLTVIDLPVTIYDFDSDIEIHPYTATKVVDFSESEVKPCRFPGGTYRYINNPVANSSPKITGVYDKSHKFSFTTDRLFGGFYKTYVIDHGSDNITHVDYPPEIGDYLCSTQDGSSWYLIPGELPVSTFDNVVGIITRYVHHPSDHSDYSSSGINARYCHGYAIALTDVSNSGMYYSNFDPWESGISTNNSDWDGYKNQKIMEGIDIDFYPAAKACRNYHKSEFGSKYAAPANTSGWFLPSCGQLYDMFALRSMLSSRMEKCREELKDPNIAWLKKDIYWSSTGSVCAEDALAWAFNVSIFSKESHGTRENYYVRPVIAF